MDKKLFWEKWDHALAPLFTEQGLTWKGKQRKLGYMKRADGFNILVSVAIHDRIYPVVGGQFLVGIAVSEIEKFEEHVQANVAPVAVGDEYPREIKRINTQINARIRDSLAASAEGQELLSEPIVEITLRSAVAHAHRFRDECDMDTWRDFFARYVPAALAHAQTFPALGTVQPSTLSGAEMISLLEKRLPNRFK